MIVAYLFPGQGAQRVGMGVELAETSPAAAAVFAEASAALEVDLLALCRQGPEEVLADTEVAQPTLLTVGIASLAAARRWLPEPAWLAGLSLGEYTALVAAGALDLADALRLVRARGRLMTAATRGRHVAMAAVVGLEAEAVAELCASVSHAGCCQPALVNAARQVVVSGDRAAVDLLVDLAERGSARATRLQVSSAFHTSLMTPAAPELGRLLGGVRVRAPTVPVVANVTGRPVTSPAQVRECLLRQLDQPVRWADTMSFLLDCGVDTVLELGPGRVLSRLARHASRWLVSLPVEDAETLDAVRARFGSASAPRPAPEDGVVRVSAERAEAYRQAGYWTGELLADAILATASRQPTDRPALVSGADVLRHRELAGAVDQVGAALAARGIGHGDRVVVQLPNGPAFVVLVLALWRLGAVAVMALPAYGEREVRHVLETSDAVGLAVTRRHRRTDYLALARRLAAERTRPVTLLAVGLGEDAAGDEVDLDALLRPAAPPSPAPVPAMRPDPADLALLLLSGGTTGLPKLIPRTHRDYRYNVEVASAVCGLDADTVYLAALPVAHNFALGCPGVLGTLLQGGTVAFPTNAQPAALLEALDTIGATVTAAVPTLALQLAEAAAERGTPPRTLRLVQIGGARLLPEASRRVRAALGCRVQQVYGMAEGLLNFTRGDDPDEVVDETQGRPASPADEVRIVDRSGRLIPDGEVGELLTRGPYTIAGYYRGGPREAEAFDPDGFFRTGDLVRRHPSGNLVVEGRLKDVINRAGEKVSAAELEDVLLRHPAVRQVAAVAAPDRFAGECVCVVAALRPGVPVTLGELRAFLLGHGFARYKLPDRLLLLDDLPLTAVGKVDKVELRRLAALESA